jgi:hypothetical protein
VEHELSREEAAVFYGRVERSFVFEVVDEGDIGDWITCRWRSETSSRSSTGLGVSLNDVSAATVRRTASKREPLPVDYQSLTYEDTGAPICS